MCPIHSIEQAMRYIISGGYFPEIWVEVYSKRASGNPYPISDQNMWFSLPYFRPDPKFDTLFQTTA